MTIYFEDMTLGQTASFRKTVTEADIVLFAGITGDHNPIHTDEEYARTTPFGRRIAHGLLTSSLVSTVLGNQLPGPGTIYMSQTMRFMAPVFIGDTVTASVEVTALDAAKLRVTLATRCSVAGHIVLEGEALVKAPSRLGAVDVSRQAH
ncbi:MaoC family dehydratase [Chitinimonas sp. BJB300]|uniref:MaoC family dehydratase n=1 Tax=Chitinimonas sp. BJB300 TaxID=1559339 RepID=UPI000C10D6B7|nr:MaoC family dehydratase [Chitinimonas sp. BJB300]PHV10765.1 (R)-hydratase [Chitinimonas sp. BJB300]TSJ89986.1 MaoC family dehydratase [Chitinimonas sp. BJB300]